jgi:hypothetical protein
MPKCSVAKPPIESPTMKARSSFKPSSTASTSSRASSCE